jgi:Tfp pilus assembly protein PilV
MELEHDYQRVGDEMRPCWWKSRHALTGVREEAAMKRLRDARGVTLVETMIAVLIALIGVFGLGSLVFQATATNKNQGTETTRATIYAQDKIEKLLSIGTLSSVSTTNFTSCTATASSQPAGCNTTGITDSGWTQGLLAGGQLGPLQTTCPTSGASVGYIDYLDANGGQVTGTCSSIEAAVPAYIRQWEVVDLTSSTTPPAFTGLPVAKRITVAVYSQVAVNAAGGKPVVVLTSLLSNPN